MMFDKSAYRSGYRAAYPRRRSSLFASFLTLALVGALTAPAPASGEASTPAPFETLDVGEPTELYAALFQYRNQYVTIGVPQMWEYSAEAYGADDRSDPFVRDDYHVLNRESNQFHRIDTANGFLGFIPKDRMHIDGYPMEQLNLYRSGHLDIMIGEKPGDFATLTEAAKNQAVAEVSLMCNGSWLQTHWEKWILFVRTWGLEDISEADKTDWCAAASGYTPYPSALGKQAEVGFVFKEDVPGLGLIPLYWHLRTHSIYVNEKGHGGQYPAFDIRIGRQGDFPTEDGITVRDGEWYITTQANPSADEAHLVGYVFPAVPGFVESPTLVDTTGLVQSPVPASTVHSTGYDNYTSLTQNLPFSVQYEQATTLSVSESRSQSTLRGVEFGVKVGVEAGVDIKGFSAKVSTEFSASTSQEKSFTLGSTNESVELSSTVTSYTVPLAVAPYTNVVLEAAIYNDIVGSQTYSGLVAPYWRHADDDRVWDRTARPDINPGSLDDLSQEELRELLADTDIVPTAIEFDISASRSSRLTATARETLLAAPPGLLLIRDATTVDEIRSASDYSAADADTLRLYRAFLNREPDCGGSVYWIGLTQRGFNPDDLAWSFGASAEFKARYGDLSNKEFLELIYRNMLGRDPEPGGFNYWLGLMERDTKPLHQHEIVRWVVANPEFIGHYPYAPMG